MPKFEALTYYEILDVPIDASPFEIRQAYKEALSIYGRESTIGYAFFVEEEREDILKRIEDAFATLVDEESRNAYDRRLVQEKKIDPLHLEKRRQKKPTPLFTGKSSGQRAVSKTLKEKIQSADLEEIKNEILSLNVISGDDLKRMRDAVGVKIEEIFEVTRITVSILEAIETDDLKTLPSNVYLKNFLRAYAELFGLDAGRIIEGYLKNLEDLRSMP